MNFTCIEKNGNKKETWEGTITEIQKQDNCHEIWISSRSSIMLLFGNTSRGKFACFPDFNVGCHLVNLKDRFWNREKLVDVMGKADGITVEAALYALSSKINL